MKKLIFAALLALYAGIGIAQESSNENDNRKKLQVGFKAGLNYSNVYDEKGEEFKTDPKFGFTLGTFLAIPFGKYLGIQPEVQLSQKGFKASGMILGNRYNFTRTTTFIDIPLQIALKPSEFLTLLGGPQYSYLLKQRDVFSNSTSSFSQEQEFQHDNIRKNIFGFVVGFDINLNHVTLGARVNWDIQNNNEDGTSSTPRYKNVCYQGTIGYKFYKKTN